MRRRIAEDQPLDASEPAHGEDAPQKPAAMRMLFAIFPAWVMVVIWAVVIGNWAVHTVMRDIAWDAVTLLLGHVLLALQIVSFWRCTQTHPGTLPKDWPDHTTLPPRAFFLGRRREVILGFDHYCWWLGAPIGFRNRRFFMLFLFYSSVLCLFGLNVCWTDSCRLLDGLCSRDESHEAAVHRAMRVLPTGIAPAFAMHGPLPFGGHGALRLALVLAETDPSVRVHAIPVLVLALIDLVAGLILSVFSAYHVYLAMRNRTTLGGGRYHGYHYHGETVGDGVESAGEEIYDLGPRANWLQIFGPRWWLWPLPLMLDDAPQGDGIHWPTAASGTHGTKRA